MGPLLNLTREGNRIPSLRSSLSLSLYVCVCDGPAVDSDARVVPFHWAGTFEQPTLLSSHTANGMTLQ